MQKKIVFMGTPKYAAVILNALYEAKFDIVGVFTQADKPFGRKQELKMSEVKDLALQKNIAVFTPKSLKDETVSRQIKDLKPDFIVVAAYGKILPKDILKIAPCINLHASLLPKYRGASPIQAAILNGDETSGVCSMLMDEGLDTGAVLKSTEISIKDKKASILFDEFALQAAGLCVQTLNEFESLKAMKQDDNKASYCTKIKKEDGLVSLENAREIYQKFLAFYPWPGVFLKNGLKFIDLELVDEKENQKIAQILSIDKEGFHLACKKGTLKIKALQEVGKKVLRASDFLNGKRLRCEDYLC